MSENGLNRKIRLLSIGLGLLFLIFGIFIYAFFSVPSQKFQNKIFWIEPGETSKQTSQNLKKEKIIKSSFVFDSLIYLNGKEKEIKAGKYIFKKPENVLKVLNIILKGPNIELVKITIPEGWTKERIGDYFGENGFFSFPKNEWLNAASTSEGYLFPDTYFIDKDARPGQIVKIMSQNFNSKISQEMREAIRKNGKNFNEILIMASLIEKEAFDSLEEKSLISGILWKRLENNMPLQVDATVSYIVGRPSLKLTDEDLAIDSPYNTYKYRGLPPSAIGNPGLESIIAAVYPKNSPYLYYLHAKNGKIYYAKTFEEHKRNKAKYLK
jgi:UPF0755 protein